MRRLKNVFRELGKINYSLALSLLAIVISFAQLILSSPILSEFYSRPELVVRGVATTGGDKVSWGSFTISNEGRSSATNVEIGFVTRIGDQVLVVPSFSHKKTLDKTPLVIDHVRLEFSKILPGESLVVLILNGEEHPMSKTFADHFKSDYKTLPMVSYLRSDQGSGKIDESNISPAERARLNPTPASAPPQGSPGA